MMIFLMPKTLHFLNITSLASLAINVLYQVFTTETWPKHAKY